MYVSELLEGPTEREMVRRTKEEAQETRNRILDAAERVFLERGVARTSLNEIATAAGVTRGAIYWHFQDKADVFNAMMVRVTLPFEEASRRIEGMALDPLASMREILLMALDKTVHDPQVRRVFEIAVHKVEYVDELTAVRDRHIAVRNEFQAQSARALELAAARGDIVLRLPAAHVAIGLHALFDGLLQNWLLDPKAFDLKEVGSRLIDTYLNGLKPD